MATVREIIEALQEMPQDLELRFAHQPSYPLQNNVQRQVALRTEGSGGEQCVYLLDEGQCYDYPYAPSGIFNGELTDTNWTEELYCPECEYTNIQLLESNERSATVKCLRAQCGKVSRVQRD